MGMTSVIRTVTLGLVLGLTALPVTAAEPTIVRIEDYKFLPAQITVKAGTTVRWLNAEKRTSHSIWFKDEGLEESPRFFPEEYWERTFDRPGTYPYTCGPHPEMKAVVEVIPR